MTIQSSDQLNPFKDLDVPNLKIYAKHMARFVEDKIASYMEPDAERTLAQKATLYRYRYPGGPNAIARFSSPVRYSIVFSILGLDELFNKITHSASSQALYGLRAIIVSIDDFIKQHYNFFSDVYSSHSYWNIVETSEDNLSSKKFRKLACQWMIVAIDQGNDEFANKCPFLWLDFQNVLLYEISKNKPNNLDDLLKEAVPEVSKIYNAYKIAGKESKEYDKIKGKLKIYFNEHRNAFNLVKEIFLNNDFLYSSDNVNVFRRDFCGRLLSQIVADYGFSRPGAQALFRRMVEIEKTNAKKSAPN
jgi:hypothetical protein